MRNYMYENMWTQGLEDAIDVSTTKPLIIEMFYKYGVRVYDMKEGQVYNKRTQEFEATTNFYMTIDGSPACSVASRRLQDNRTEYMCYMPFYNKLRAADDCDRHSITSIKLVNLIKMIDKHKALRTSAVEYIKRKELVNSIAGMWSRKLGDRKYKRIEELKISHVEKLLAYMVGDINRKDLDEETITQSKVYLDKWKDVDDNNNRIEKELDNIFCNDFYMLGIDSGNGMVIGKVVGERVQGKISVLEEVKPFQRVRCIEEYEDKDKLIPILTMFKLLYEETDTLCKHGIPLRADSVNLDLNIASYYLSQNSYFEGAWLLIPNME